MTEILVPNDYAAAIAYLYSRINYEQVPPVRSRKLTLEHMRRLLEVLGNPHLRIPVVHVAGTKGKGSTAAMVSSVLTRAGYRTGLYTSPHLSRLEERFAVDGMSCSPEDLVELTDQIRTVATAVDREIQGSLPDEALTFFEITTAIMWLYFVRRQVDIVVLEVGMGGRLDSTNLCNPLVSVITSISFDHTKQLGNTLAAIASEKAGIIKPGVPVVSGVEQPEAQAVIREVAQLANAPLFAIGNEFQVRRQPVPTESSRFSQENRMDYYELGPGENRCSRDLAIGLLGDHQLRNAGVALAIIGRLQEQGWRIDEQAIRDGLAKVRCSARIEIVGRNPTLIVDTAHNVASIAALIETLNQHKTTGQRVLIFAASRDKDIRGMLQLLLPQFDQIVFTQFATNPRAVDAESLAGVAAELIRATGPGTPYGIVNVRKTSLEAWRYCREVLKPMDLGCVTGSFFLAAEMRAVLLADSAS